MRHRFLAAFLSLALLPAAAGAQSLPTLSLPILAVDPRPEPSIWHGLSVGAEVTGVVAKHGGGVGADVFAGYDREFANNIVLGFRGTTGYAPSLYDHRVVRGYDFAAADIRLGYDMGRIMPFVTAGLALARPHFGAAAATPGGDSLTEVLNGSGDTRTLTRVGAGVEVAVTDRLTIGVAVQHIQGRGLLLP